MGTNHDARIPEDVIERAACAWESDFESYTSTLRAEALEDASRALTASGLSARVAELEAAIEEYMLWEPGRAGHAEAHRKLLAALNAKGAPE